MRWILAVVSLLLPVVVWAAGPPPLLTAPFPLSSFERVGDRAVFIQYKPEQAELWATDGSAAGTVRLPLDCAGCTFLRFAAHGGDHLYFSLEGRLGVTDGTPGGTRLLQDEGEDFLDVFPYDPVFVGPRLFFAGHDSAAGTELWTSDGTVAGTGSLVDIRPGAESSLPHPAAVLNGGLLFAAQDALGTEPWFSDGTAEGTFRIADLDPGPASSIFFLHAGLRDDLAVFFADAPGRELWRTDGTADGTVQISDFRPGDPDGAFDVSDFLVVGERAFFTATTTIGFDELWITDGSATGTVPLTRFGDRAEVESSFVPGGGLLGLAGGRVVFNVRLDGNRLELWASDGTVEGTRRLTDVCDDNCTPRPRALARVGDLLYLRIEEPILGDELWVTDGIAALPMDLCPGSCSSEPELLISDPETLYVVADDGASGRELHRIRLDANLVPRTPTVEDPDNPTVLRLTDFTIPEPFVHQPPPVDDPQFPTLTPSPPGGGPPFVPAPVGPFRGVALPDGRLLFAATDVGTGFALFTSDGTPEGFQPFFTLGPARQVDECAPGMQTLCLTQDRFRVEVAWSDPRSGDSGAGNVLPGATLDDSGFFWFFDEDNVELVVKVLDARAVNGHFWVFTASLTDVARTITVTDTLTGQVNAYEKPAGDPTGRIDVTAFE